MNYELFLMLTKMCFVCFVVNIPFGMLRSRMRSFTVLWFICIHAPIPISAIMRREAGLSFWYIFLFMIFSILGQIIGKKFMLKFFSYKGIV